jgi:hypothetical protein
MQLAINPGHSPAPAFHRWAAAAIIACLAYLSGGPAHGQDLEIWAIEMRQGDTISAISKRYLKNPNDWLKLQQFNKVRLDRAMPVGTRINVPADWMRLDDIDAQVVAANGKVRIERAGSDIPVKAGVAVKVGDKITADAGSSVSLKFPDGTISSIHANTTASIDRSRGVPGTDLIAQRLRLDAGRIEHSVTPRKNASSTYEVQTSVSTIGVRGTKFRTVVDDTSRGEVTEGRVAAQGTGSPTPVVVDAGFATVINASGVPSKPLALLPPPDLSKNPNAVELSQPQITFEPLLDAVQYRAIVARDPAFSNVVTEMVSKLNRLVLPPLSDGPHFVRVRGIDANRIEGQEAQHAFTVKIGLPPPPSVIAPEENAIVPGVGNIILSWAPEKLAASYRFQVDDNIQFRRVLHAAQRTTSLRFAISGLKPGRYFWRLASNRPDGSPGPWGPIYQFMVNEGPPPAAAQTPPAQTPPAQSN